MTDIVCKHCGGEVNVGDENCSHCGIPLPPGFGENPRKKFIRFFIALIIFCGAMIIWLPPDWTRFIK